MNNGPSCEKMPVKTQELEQMGQRLSKLYSELSAIKERLEVKRAQVFGVHPEAPEPCRGNGPISGGPNGQIAVLRDQLANLEERVVDIRGIVAALEDL